jgi:hypothetical protein
VLTDAQKAKLSMLSDAIKLIPVISEAQSGNLLGSTNSPPFAFSASSSGIISGVIGFPSVPGCAVNGAIGIAPPAQVVGANGTSTTAGNAKPDPRQ